MAIAIASTQALLRLHARVQNVVFRGAHFQSSIQTHLGDLASGEHTRIMLACKAKGQEGNVAMGQGATSEPHIHAVFYNSISECAWTPTS